jgi:hypothetical protein
MQMDHREVITDIWSAEILFRKTQKCPLYNLLEDHSIPFYRDTPESRKWNRENPVDNTLNITKMTTTEINYSYFQNLHHIGEDFGTHLFIKENSLHAALSKYPYNLFVGGGYLCSYMQKTIPTSVSTRDKFDIDIFVVAASPEEAELIIMDFAEIYENDVKDQSFRSRVIFHPMVVSWIHPNSRYLKVQLIRRLYTSRDQICAGFDLWPSQIIWSAGHGMECSLMALYAFKTGYFPVDVSKMSDSTSFRQLKYVINKNFSILFPGLPSHSIGDGCSDVAKLQDFQGVYISSSTGYTTLVLSMNTIYRHGDDEFTSDYEADRPEEECTEFWHNWSSTLKGNVFPITVTKYSDMRNLTTNLMLRSCFVQFKQIHTGRRLYSMKNLRTFFRTEEEWRVWSTLYYVEMDYKKAEEIWTANLVSYVSHVPELCSDLTKFWKVKNPGEQRFGQNHPIRMSARNYYGPNYVPTYAGMSHENYFLLKCWINNNARLCNQICPRDVITCIIKVYLKMCEESALKALNFKTDQC